MNDEPILLFLMDDPDDPWLNALERLTVRFWSKVTVAGSDDCWEWQGCRDHYGYGRFSLHPIPNIPATWVALAMAGRPVLRGQSALHTCPGGDNPACCNPKHLRPGSQAENVRDMIERGRANPGGMRRKPKLEPIVDDETCPSE